MNSKQIVSKKIIPIFNYLYSITIVFSHVPGYVISGLGFLLLPCKFKEVIKCNIVKLILLFLIYGLTISFFSENPNKGYLTIFSYFAHWLLPFYLGYILSERDKIKKVLLLYCSILGILALLSILAYFGFFWNKFFSSYLGKEGLLKGFRHHIGFAALLSNTSMVAFSISIFASIFSKLTRLYFLTISAICLLGVILTGARSYYIALTFSIVLFLIWISINKRKYYLVILLLFAFSGSIFISYNIFPNVRERINSALSGNDPSVNERIALYKVALLVIKDNLLFGIGPGQATSEKRYFEKVQVDFYNPEGRPRHKHLHSFYLNLIAEFGLCGFAIFIYIIVHVFSRLINMYNQEDILFKTLSVGMIFGFISILIGEFFDTYFRGPDVAMEMFWFFGLISGLRYENSKI